MNDYFLSQAEEGTLPKETLSTLRLVRGVRFDYQNKRMLFPLSEHDNLQVALATIRVTVEPLPRQVIAAAQLSHRRDNPNPNKNSSSTSSSSSSSNSSRTNNSPNNGKNRDFNGRNNNNDDDEDDDEMISTIDTRDNDDGKDFDIESAIQNKIDNNLNSLRGKIKERLLQSLAPFQREGVLFVLNNNGRALIADEMGLGK